MKISEIQEIIKKECSQESTHNVVAIDGPWGCGKTYQILQFMKSNKKIKKIYYLSLFGYESIGEINLALFNISHKIRKLMTKTIKILSKVAKPWDPIKNIDNVIESLDFQLKIEKPKNKKIIVVFDDLERISEKIKYSDLLGYFNALTFNKCKIICLLASENIRKGKLKDFNKFKEKVFDRFYKVNEHDLEIFNNVFSDFPEAKVANFYSIFDNNIRFAKKVVTFYKEIKKHYDDNKEKFRENMFEDSLILKACAFCIKACLSEATGFDNINQENKDQNDYNFFDKIDVKEHMEFNLQEFKSLILSLSKVFLNSDFTEIDKNFFEDHLSILDQTYFYLSDERKQKYIQKLEEEVKNEKSKYDYEQLIKKALNLVEYEKHEFKQEFIQSLAARYYSQNKEWVRDNSKEIFLDFPYLYKTENYILFRDAVVKCVNQLIKKDILNTLTNANINFDKKYSILKRYENYFLLPDERNQSNRDVNKFTQDEREEISECLIEHDFYFPDLGEDITASMWLYCHEMGKIISFLKLEEKFFDFAKKTCSSNKENNSLIDRYYSIIIKYMENYKTISKEQLIQFQEDKN